MRLLTGDDDLDTWSAPIWRNVLSNARIVVSTYQVLLDALIHAYIRVADLALVVFDEGLFPEFPQVLLAPFCQPSVQRITAPANIRAARS